MDEDVPCVLEGAPHPHRECPLCHGHTALGKRWLPRAREPPWARASRQPHLFSFRRPAEGLREGPVGVAPTASPLGDGVSPGRPETEERPTPCVPIPGPSTDPRASVNGEPCVP